MAETVEPRPKIKRYSKFATYALMLLWVGVVYIPVALLLLALHLRSFVLLGVLILLAVLPVPRARWGEALAEHIIQCASLYFPITLTLEDSECVQADNNPSIYCIEPHSVFPLAPIALNPRGVYKHKLTANTWPATVFLAAAVVFNVPFVRQLWTWLQLEPVSRHKIREQIQKKNANVLLTPGGAEEVLHMGEDHEVVIMSQRFGLAKVALQTGADLVPAFAFRQRETFTYYRLGPPLVPKRVANKLTKMLGMVPLVFGGRFAISPMPKQVPMHVVVGTPIRVQQQVDDPSKGEIQQLLKKLMDETHALYERHKHQCGHGDVPFTIL